MSPDTRVQSWRICGVALLSLAALSACGGVLSATFAAGVMVELSTEDFALPDALREESPSGPRIRELPCGPMGMCPSAEGVAIVCDADVCNPEPQTLSFPVGDVDFDELAAGLDDGFGEIDTLEVLDLDYLIESNTLSVDTTEVEIFWGPAGAVSIGDDGVQRLGVVPAISAGESGEGSVTLDAAGAAALSLHFETVQHRFRFFARTVVDLEPGGAFPEGALEVSVRLRVRISGSLI